MKIKVERTYIHYPKLGETDEEWRIYHGIPILLLPFLTRWVLDKRFKSQEDVMKYLDSYISCAGVTIKTTVR